ncbi:alpha/beta hydrolase [Gammaproteobacteria bacterium]|nr:alpha/beta hydrolase [Gammaproteobacteria bacterium]
MYTKKYSQNIKINNPDKYNLTENIVWSSPQGFDLTMDIYSQKNTSVHCPIVVMFHGGGFLIRRKEILNNMAQYIASNHNYVVCNVNYRLLRDQSNTVLFNDLIGDAFGSILWIKENIHKYNGDKEKIGITGDSAGACICAMILNLGNKIGKKEYFGKDYAFEPSYLPEDLSLEEVSRKNLLDVKAAVLSYGAYDLYRFALQKFETYKNIFWWLALSKPRGVLGEKFNPIDHPEIYKAISPIYNIPDESKRKLPPQLLTAATKDRITPVRMIKEYGKALEEKNQEFEFWEHINRNHAYLDSGRTLIAGNDFIRDGIPALKVMMDFFAKHL